TVAGSYDSTAPLGSADAWVMQLVAFKAAPTGPPPAPPSAPNNLAATAASSARIDLSWTNTSTTQSGVKIERSTDNATFTQIALAGATAASYPDVGLSASTTYFYRVRATNVFCCGHALLADGRVFVAGGHSSTHVGITNATIFDPSSRGWSSAAPMPAGRWYPTVTALPDGRMLVTAGEIACNGCNALIPAIYDPAFNPWMELPTSSQNVPYYPAMFA